MIMKLGLIVSLTATPTIEEKLKALRYQYAPDSVEIVNQQAAVSAAQAEYLALMDAIEQDDALVTLKEELLPQESEDSESDTEYDSREDNEIMEVAVGVYVLSLNEDGTWVSNIEQLLQRRTQSAEDRIDRIRKTTKLNLALVSLEHAAGEGTVFVTIA